MSESDLFLVKLTPFDSKVEESKLLILGI